MLPRMKSASVDLNSSHKNRKQELIYLIGSLEFSNVAEFIKVLDEVAPVFFDLISKFQYRQACTFTTSKIPHILVVAFRLGAACESTYHLMKYLETDYLDSCRIDTMYTTFIHLLRHVAKELHMFMMHPTRSSVSRNCGRDAKIKMNRWGREILHDRSLLATRQRERGAQSNFNVDRAQVEEESRQADTPKESIMLLTGLSQYYWELFAQAAGFFQIRSKMIRIYRSLACPSPRHDYEKLTISLKGLKKEYESFDHPLLGILKISGLREIESIEAAFRCEIMISSCNSVAAIVALHELKKVLKKWTAHKNILVRRIVEERSSIGNIYRTRTRTKKGFLWENTASVKLSSESKFCTDAQLYHLGKPGIASKFDPSMICLEGTSSPFKNHSVTETLYVQSIATAASLEMESTSFANSQYIFGSEIQTHRNHDHEDLPFSSSKSPYTLNEANTPSLYSEGKLLCKSVSVGRRESNDFPAFHSTPKPRFQSNDCDCPLRIYQWSHRFFHSLIAKFYIYFAHSLAQQYETHLEMQAFIKNSSLFQEPPIPTFDQRADLAQSTHNGGVILLLEQSYLEKGKHHTLHSLFSSCEKDSTLSALQRDDQSGNWTAIFVYPSPEILELYWLDLIHQIETKRKHKSISHISFESHNKQQTYNIAQVDRYVYLCVIVENNCQKIKASQKFLEALTQNLQHTNVFQNLEPPTIGPLSVLNSPLAHISMVYQRLRNTAIPKNSNATEILSSNSLVSAYVLARGSGMGNIDRNKTGEKRVASSTNDSDDSGSRSEPLASARNAKDLPKSLSSTEATEQLHTLCEKFAVLTEKVQEETKVRQEAEKEIQRLKKILEQHEFASPCSLLPCSHDTHDMSHEFEAVQDQLRKELRLEKEKNEQLIRRALELEREKKLLLQYHGTIHDSDQSDILHSTEIPLPPPAPPSHDRDGFRRRPGHDNNTFQHKIQETLTVTIKELEQELDRKDHESTSLRNRLERERMRVKQLQAQHREDESQEQRYRVQVDELRSEALEAQNMIVSLRLQVEEKEQQIIQARERDEESTSEIHSLQEINGAMEKRCSMLMRRFDSSTYALKETEELKAQVLDLETENCTLTQTVQELRSLQSQRDQDWKRHFDVLKADKINLESKLSVLKLDLQSATQRNDLLSEWMLVRNGHSLTRDLQEPITASNQRHGTCLTRSRNEFTPSHCQRCAEQNFPVKESNAQTNCSNTFENEHTRIRELMVRNRELQQRLQMVLMRSTLIRLSGRCRTVRAQLQCLSLVRLPMRVISTHSVNNIQLQTPQQLLCPAQQHVRTFAKTKKQNKSPESEEFDAEELKAKSRRNMNGAILNFTRQLSQMRPGKADGGIFDTVHVQAYGQSVPLPQLAQIAVTGAYSLSVNVYDHSLLQEVKKTIANVNACYSIREEISSLVVTFPKMSKETRIELSKSVKKQAEQARSHIRRVRQDSMNTLKKSKEIAEDDVKEMKDAIQKLTDQCIVEIDALLEQKEKDLVAM
ncbi:hypothetical protein ABG067_002598 [Albugo candida]